MRSADIVVRLDRHRWPAGERHAFDYVRIKRALREEVSAANLLGFLFEHIDEQLADDLALLLGIVDAGKLLQEQVFGLNVHQRNVVMIAEKSSCCRSPSLRRDRIRGDAALIISKHPPRPEMIATA